MDGQRLASLHQSFGAVGYCPQAWMGCTRMGLYILYAREVQRAKTARQENELTPGLTVREQIELGAKWKQHEWLSDAINNFVDWNEMIWLL